MANYYKAPTYNFVSTTLNGSINDSVTTITLNDASKLQAPGYIVIDREDGNGTATANSREVVYFTGKSGNDLTGCSRGADNSTARSHSDGALVEATLTVGMWNDLRDGVAAAITTDGAGAHLSNVTVSQVMHATRIVGTSVASIAQSYLVNTEVTGMALSSLASIARGQLGTLFVANHLYASGASIEGISTTGGLNASFQVPGSLASQADVAGMLVVPAAYTAQSISGYVKTPSSTASIALYIRKQGGTDVAMLTILGGATYASGASLAVTALSAGDTLQMDIRSTASLAQDLSVVLRAS